MPFSSSQHCAELTEAISDLFNHIGQIRSALDRVAPDFNHHFASVSECSPPPTQPVSSQGASSLP